MPIEIHNSDIIKMGFTQTDNHVKIDGGDAYYDWFEMTKNDHIIEISKEYDMYGEFILQYAMLNGNKLNGWMGLSVEIEMLIDLM